MPTLDELLVRIDASTELLRRELNKGDADVGRFQRKTEQRLGSIDRRFSVLGRNIRSTLASLGLAVSAGAFVQFTRSAIAAGDAIGKAARTAGVGAEQIQELRFAFGQLAGTTDKEVDESLRRFNRRIGLAVQGQGEALKTVRQMNLALRDQAGQVRATGDVLEEVLVQLAAIESDSVRAARASQLFGEDAGPRLAAALGEGIDAMTALREAVPGVLSNANVRAAEELTDAFDKMARTIGGSLKNALVGSTAQLGQLLGLIELTEETNLLIRLEQLNENIRNAQAAQATGSLGGNTELLLNRAIEERRRVEAQLAILRAGNNYGPPVPAEFGGQSQRRLEFITPGAPNSPAAIRSRIQGGLSTLSPLQAFPAGFTQGIVDRARSAGQAVGQARAQAREIASTLNELSDDVEDRWTELGNTMGYSIRSTLASAFQGVKVDFGDLIKGMIADLAASGLLRLIGGAIGGPVGAFFSAAGRAEGGPVSAGRAYVVGERAPELFVPRTSGMIYNGAQLAGSVTVVQNIRFDVGLESVDSRIAAAAPRIAEAARVKVAHEIDRRRL